MRNNKGYSLVEVLVALGIMSFIFALSGYQAIQMKELQARFTKSAEALTSTTFAENFLWEKLKVAGISYNVMIAPDDNNQNFFDYVGDLPERLVPPPVRNRVLTISDAAGARREFFLMTYDYSLSPTVVLDPAVAYTISPPTSPIVPPVFTYSGLNANGRLPSRLGEAWAPGKNFLLMNPMAIRPMPASGVVDMSQPGKPMIYLGQVNSAKTDLAPTNYPFIRRDDPRNSSVFITSPDQFFRNLPLAAGSAPIVHLVPVQIIRFWLESNTQNTKTSSLYYGVMEGSTTVGRFMLSDDVKMVRLKRSSVTSRLITARICSEGKVEACSN